MAEKLKIMCTGEIEIDFHDLKDLQLTKSGKSLKVTSQDKIDKLAKSLKKYGIINNLQIWKDDNDIYCFDAHHRKKALLQLEKEGLKIPLLPATRCLVKTKKEAKKLLILKESTNSWIDTDVIKDFLSEIDFGIEEAQGLIEIPDFDWPGKENKNDPDKLPDEPKEIFIKKGDLIELGEHRLLCGDSTIAKNIELLMNGERADMVFTDPPYGINLDTDYKKINVGTKNIQGKKYAPVAGDNKEFDPSIILKTFEETKEIFFWGADYYIHSLPPKGSLFIWDKRASDIENEYKQENIDRISGNHFEICWSKEKHRKEIIRMMWAGLFGMESDKSRRFHPTQKPLRLCELFINRYSKANYIIIDLYLGSGSTLIACEKTNRKCFAVEIEPHYCQIVIQRWCDYTEKSQIKINGKPIDWREQ